jgi:hypothetical protein
VNVRQRAEKPHYGQLGEIGVQLAVGRCHPWSAIANRFQIGCSFTQPPDQVRGVQIAARLAGTEK